MTDLESKVASLITEACPHIPKESLTVDASLRGLGMTSLDFIKVIILIEEHFSFEYPEELMTHDHVRTIKLMADSIMKIQKGVE